MSTLRLDAVATTRIFDAVASWITIAPTSEAPSMTSIVSPVALGNDLGSGESRWFLWYSPAAARVIDRGRVAACS